MKETEELRDGQNLGEYTSASEFQERMQISQKQHQKNVFTSLDYIDGVRLKS